MGGEHTAAGLGALVAMVALKATEAAWGRWLARPDRVHEEAKAIWEDAREWREEQSRIIEALQGRVTRLEQEVERLQRENAALHRENAALRVMVEGRQGE